MRKIIVIIAVLLTLATLSYSFSKTKDQEKEQNHNEKIIVEDVEDDKKTKYSKKNAKKLDFNSEFVLIRILEKNNGVVKERPTEGIASQDSYITEDGGLHLLYNAELPSKETKYIVIKEVDDDNFLIDYELQYFKDPKFEVNLNSISNAAIDNNARSFINTKLEFSMEEDGKVKISRDGTNVADLGEFSNSKHTFTEGNSSLTIESYGKINSINKISYDEIKDDNDLAEEYKRKSDIDKKDGVITIDER